MGEGGVNNCCIVINAHPRVELVGCTFDNGSKKVFEEGTAIGVLAAKETNVAVSLVIQ